MTSPQNTSTAVGMLGAGFILASHARSVAALPQCRLAVVGDASQGRAASAMREFGFPRSVNSIEAMAASDCDSVHVLLPPTLHEHAALAMIEAGKSVFVEKPFVLSSAAALSLAEAAERRGVRLGVNHNFLFGRNYQPIREAVRSGALGRIDALSIDWQYELGLIKHGPFDNWIVAGPANPLFEIAPHPIAFALDLLGELTIDHVECSGEADLPSGVRVPRRWRVLGTGRGASVVITIAFTPGHEARCLSVRGDGGGARYDYGRDIGGIERKHSDNPLFDSFGAARAAGRQLREQAATDLRRRLAAALRKAPGASPFEESVFRSISGFYAATGHQVDPRHDARFAAETIRLVETIARAAGFEGPAAKAPTIAAPEPERPSDVLVVGGTGFIGRALIKRLLGDGHGVRVLTRSASSAALALKGLPVEIVTGSHGDPAVAAAALQGIDIVYHLAKCEGRKWQDYLEGDVEPTRVLGQAAARAGVKRFIYTGTIDSYDSANPKKRIDNATLVDPRVAHRNLYARSKATCEESLRALAASDGLRLVIMRPGIVIGAGSPPAHPGVARFLSETELEYWGDGSNRLPLVHVDDVADALAKAARTKGIDGQTFLVSGPLLMSARDYVAALETLAGTRIASRAGSPLRFWLKDAVKEGAKHLVRHPNRRSSTLHDWQCRSHRANYDPSDTMTRLGWSPIADVEELCRRGIGEALAER